MKETFVDRARVCQNKRQKNNQLIAVLFSYIIWISTLPACSAAAEESPVPSLFVFGDSLVDVGNNNHLVTVAKGDYPYNGIDFPEKKPTGRFSNGKVAADLLAEKLNLPFPPPYLSLKKEENYSAIFTGVSFASGGAGIFDSTYKNWVRRISLWQQIQDYTSVYEELMNHLELRATQNHLSKSIFMIVIGSNDLLAYILLPDLRKKFNPQQYTRSMATTLKDQLKTLYSYGARKFLVVGIGLMGCIPTLRVKNRIQGCNEKANLWCTMYNEALKTMLEELRQGFNGSLSYSYFDTYKIMHDIVADPAAYGFMDATSACCGGGKLNAKMPCVPGSKYCSNRTQYFFWDRFGHPTEAASRVLVDHMFNGSSGYSFPLNVEHLVSI